MLGEFRKVVSDFWKIPNGLDDMGVAKYIPFISQDSDIRHTMKDELTFFLFEIACSDEINDKQVDFFQQVIHMPVTRNNRAEFANSMKKQDILKFSPLLPYMVLFGETIGCNKIGYLYMQFLRVMATEYLKMTCSIDIGVLVIYYTVMKNNIMLIEKGTGKKVEFDPFESIVDDKKELVRMTCDGYARKNRDANLEKVMNALEKVVNDTDDNSTIEEMQLRIFKDGIKSLL